MDKRIYKELYRSLQKKNLENGKWPFTIPFGYKKVFSHYETVVWNDKNKGKRIRKVSKFTLIIDDQQAQVIKNVFIAYSSGLYSYESLSQWIVTKYNQVHSIQNLYKLLSNRFYIGEMIIEGVTYKHSYGSLISQNLFEEVQKLKIKNSTRKSKVVGVLPYIYRGLISCKSCERILSPEKHKRWIYYTCSKCKPRTTISEDYISSYLLSLFDDIFLPLDFLNTISLSLKEDLIYFIQNFKQWFLKKPTERKFIISFLCKNIICDKKNLIISLKSPFDKNNIQEFNSYDLINLFNIFGYNTYKTKRGETSTPDQMILELCKDKHSMNQLIEKLPYTFHELQEKLLDLHLTGKIEYDEFGYWKTR